MASSDIDTAVNLAQATIAAADDRNRRDDASHRRRDCPYFQFSNSIGTSSDSTSGRFHNERPPAFGLNEYDTPRVYRRRGGPSSAVGVPNGSSVGSTSRSRLTLAMRNVEEEERDRQAIMDRMRQAAFAASHGNPRRTNTTHLSSSNPSTLTGNTLLNEGFHDQYLTLATDEIIDNAILNEAMSPSPPPPPLSRSPFPNTSGDDESIGNLTPLDFHQTDLAGSRHNSERASSPKTRGSSRLRRPATNQTSARLNRDRSDSDDLLASLIDGARDSASHDRADRVQSNDESNTDPFSASSEVSRPASGGSLGSFTALEANYRTSSDRLSSDKRGNSDVDPETNDVEVLETKRESLDTKLPAAPSADDLNQCSGISCCICLDLTPKKNLSMIDGCKHKFCFECIEKWADRENSCPLCKERFHKIERVYKAERRSKKRKCGDAARSTDVKRVKNRSQRADYTSGSALQGLLQGMESGTLPQSLAHFIFSNIPGGIMNGYSRSASSGFPISISRSGTGVGSAWLYTSTEGEPTSERSAADTDTGRASGVRISGPNGGLPTSTTFRFRAGSGRGSTAQHLDSFRFMGGATGAGRSGQSFLDEFDVDGDELEAELGISSSNSTSVMPPWINPFYAGGNSRASRTSDSSAAAPPRSYAANGLEANAGSTAANALEIVDSDEEDIIEMVVTQT